MKRRLVLVVTDFPKQSETFIASKFLGLLRDGWDVHVVCNSSRRAEWENFPDMESNSEVRRRVHVNWRHEPGILAVLFAPLAMLVCFCRNPGGVWNYFRLGARPFGIDIIRRFYLDAQIVGLKPELIHFEFGSLAVGRMYLKELLGCKVIASFRGYDLNVSGQDDENYFREVWEQSDALHLLGEGLWQTAQRRGCPAAKPHVLIPPAIDTQYFDVGQRANGDTNTTRPLRILSVGRMTWEKGYEYSIQAIRVLLDQGVKCQLRIVGDGDMLEALAFARYQLGLKDSVQFLGAMPRAKVREEMIAADVFLHASVSEGFGNALIEAQSMSLPVVCSDAGGLPENVVEAVTGFAVPRRCPEALAEKLALIARDPELRRRMGESGRQRSIKHFQIANQIEKFGAFYSGIVESKQVQEFEKA